MKILADASLPYLERLFSKPFELYYYHDEVSLRDALPHYDILLCRSTLKVNAALLQNSKIQCVATASSGIDHIDIGYLSEQNIQWFDAKGANAESVADYILATMAYLSIHHQPIGRRVGVMGAGEVGMRVIARLRSLGLDVFVYDPLKTHLTTCSFETFKQCDILCIHANLHDIPPHATRLALNADFFESIKPHTVIINAARGGIIDEQALLCTHKNILYCTDVYQNEPNIDSNIVQYATLCTPHIAGHSVEAKANTVYELSLKLHAYYDLKPPNRPKISLDPVTITTTTWETQVLSLYNPYHETRALKNAAHKKNTFMALRAAHCFRHQFNQFSSWMDTSFLKELQDHE